MYPNSNTNKFHCPKSSSSKTLATSGKSTKAPGFDVQSCDLNHARIRWSFYRIPDCHGCDPWFPVLNIFTHCVGLGCLADSMDKCKTPGILSVISFVSCKHFLFTFLFCLQFITMHMNHVNKFMKIWWYQEPAPFYLSNIPKTQHNHLQPSFLSKSIKCTARVFVSVNNKMKLMERLKIMKINDLKLKKYCLM